MGRLGPPPRIRGIRVSHGALLRIQRQQRALATRMRGFLGGLSGRTGIVVGSLSQQSRQIGRIVRRNDQAFQNQLRRITTRQFMRNSLQLELALDKLVSRVWAQLERSL